MWSKHSLYKSHNVLSFHQFLPDIATASLVPESDNDSALLGARQHAEGPQLPHASHPVGPLLSRSSGEVRPRQQAGPTPRARLLYGNARDDHAVGSFDPRRPGRYVQTSRRRCTLGGRVVGTLCDVPSCTVAGRSTISRAVALHVRCHRYHGDARHCLGRRRVHAVLRKDLNLGSRCSTYRCRRPLCNRFYCID